MLPERACFNTRYLGTLLEETKELPHKTTQTMLFETNVSNVIRNMFQFLQNLICLIHNHFIIQ